ncbi:MAG TPA: GNAT family N-acetyltransferase [Polyangiaceae bacterium]|nr:GNAT family N-acetyltransferase [Polyangiaceae bacterium]
MTHWRRAEASDSESIVAMCLELYAEDPGVRPVDAADVRRTLETLSAEPARGSAVVLDADGHCAGYALLVSFWSNELGGEICVIDELYVEPAARGNGHATELLRALSSGVGPVQRRVVALELESTPSNQRARSLYLRVGFKAKRNTTLRLVLAASK